MRLKTILAIAALAVSPAISFAQPSDGSFSSGRRFLLKDGEGLYRDICAACHMPNGEGAKGAGAYPALARNAKLQVGAYPVFMVVNGRNAMPSFARWLDDEQIAAVVNYVRSHFGNSYRDGVTPADVRLVRPPGPQNEPPLE